MEILKDFGVQPILLVAQIINFLIVMFLLKRFLYKPLVGILDERKKRIAESMAQAGEITARLANLEEEQSQMRSDAQRKADAIIAQAKSTGKSLADEIVAQARTQAEAIMERSKAQNAAEYEKMRSELRKEVAQVAVLAAQKAVSEVLTTEQKDRITQKAAKEVLS